MENEPAFPTDNAAQVGPQTWHYEGLTKLEYFAGLAMQGMLADPDFIPRHPDHAGLPSTAEPNELSRRFREALAWNAAAIAKALLAALEKESNGKG
jgi:hypothetical protein